MKREEVVDTHHKVNAYMETNKVRPIFSDLLRQVVLNRPENPIEFLINYLDKRPRRLIMCLQGYHDDNRKRLAKVVSNKLNFKLIELSDIYANKDYHLETDAKINEKVLAELKACESVFKGIIISGYPNNLQQINFIQQCGFLPDRYFRLPFEESALREKLKSSHSQDNVNLVLKRHELQKKQLMEGLGELIDDLPLNVDEAGDILTGVLNVKISKKVLPYQSPRVVFIHPPHLVPPTLTIPIRKYLMHHVNVQKSLQKLSHKQNFKDYVQKYIRQNGGLSKQIELALIETECKSAAAKNKGFVLSGWPYKKSQLPFMKERHVSPHLIFVFDLDPQICEVRFKKLEEGDPSLFQSSKKPSQQVYKKQLAEYSQLVQQLKQKYKIQILPFDESEKQVVKTFESQIDNPKIYS